MPGAERAVRYPPEPDPGSRSLAEREPLLPALPALLDDAALTQWLADRTGAGCDVVRRRLRVKPGTSAVLAADLTDGRGRRPILVSAYPPATRDKLDKTAERAGGSALLAADPELGLVVTELAGDRDLPLLAALARRREPVTTLSYNPHRRWVGLLGGADGPVVLRAYRPGRLQPAMTRLRLLAGARAPVPAVLDRRRRLGAMTVEYVPGTVLDREATPTQLAGVGAALGRLHATTAALAGLSARAGAAARRTATLVSHLVPDEAARAARLAGEADRALAAVGEAADATVHGDLSLDQVVCGPCAARLIDLDHAHRGPAAQDFGSLLATLLAGTETGSGGHRTATTFEAVLAGYAEQRPAPDPRHVSAWQAVHLLRRSAEPFRRCHPDWSAGVRRHLDLAEAALSEISA